ncbi:hypothetical protein Tdes44962_MAKER06900 [Teratosphaeria destructans]|uniref:Uncharacterized protein n=1 Tax=Teratosphaeria destructans TaxID=418781 RepID=A0A9W7T0I6_9PEZI|nr:hypothetical protein Tdes44962_MAKER06900 [Teratosphaeria destructans]
MAGREESGTGTESSKALAALVAIVALVYNFLFAILCQYLPDDPLFVGVSITGYAWASCVLSTLGLIGVWARHPALITSFAHYLFVDTFMSALCRFVLLELFLDTFRDHHVCSDAYASPWQEKALSHDVVTSAHWQKHLMRPSSHVRRCRLALDAVQIVMFAILVGMTAAQGTLAMAMKRYGREIERWERLTLDGAFERCSIVDEKAEKV